MIVHEHNGKSEMLLINFIYPINKTVLIFQRLSDTRYFILHLTKFYPDQV